VLDFNCCGEPRILRFKLEFELAPSSRELRLKLIDLPQLTGIKIKALMKKLMNLIRSRMLGAGDAPADQNPGQRSKEGNQGDLHRPARVRTHLAPISAELGTDGKPVSGDNAESCG